MPTKNSFMRYCQLARKIIKCKRLLLAKEKRMRAAAERECRNHATKVAELERLLAQQLEENFTPAKTDPYHVVKDEFKR